MPEPLWHSISLLANVEISDDERTGYGTISETLEDNTINTETKSNVIALMTSGVLNVNCPTL